MFPYLFECWFEFQRLTTLILYISGNGLTPKSLEKVSGVVQSSVTWWRHQMEIFSALLALCAGNSPVPVNSTHKGQSRGALMFSLICAWISDWANNREAGDLRRHRGHCDVNEMSNLINNHNHEKYTKSLPYLPGTNELVCFNNKYVITGITTRQTSVMAYEITGRHQDCLLNSLYRQTSNRNQISTLLVFCENPLNPSVTYGFPNQRASSVENMFIMSISPVTCRVTSLAPGKSYKEHGWIEQIKP